MSTHTHTHPQARPGGRLAALTHRWPTLFGLVAAVALFVSGADRTTIAVVVTVAAACYLAAAAFRLPWMAWGAIPGLSVVLTAAGLLGVNPFVSLAVVVVALLAVGFARRTPGTVLAVESAGMAAFGGVAVTALLIAPTAGLVLVALALFAHGVWDIVHLRRKAVVSPSLAEACVGLDIPLALAVLATVLI